MSRSWYKITTQKTKALWIFSQSAFLCLVPHTRGRSHRCQNRRRNRDDNLHNPLKSFLSSSYALAFNGGWMLIIFTYRGFDSILRFPYETRARALGNFCRPVRPQISSYFVDHANVRIFHCGRHTVRATFAAARCSVAVLERASPYPTFTSISIYI